MCSRNFTFASSLKLQPASGSCCIAILPVCSPSAVPLNLPCITKRHVVPASRLCRAQAADSRPVGVQGRLHAMLRLDCMSSNGLQRFSPPLRLLAGRRLISLVFLLCRTAPAASMSASSASTVAVPEIGSTRRFTMQSGVTRLPSTFAALERRFTAMNHLPR